MPGRAHAQFPFQSVVQITNCNAGHFFDTPSEIIEINVITALMQVKLTQCGDSPPFRLFGFRSSWRHNACEPEGEGTMTTETYRKGVEIRRQLRGDVDFAAN